MIVLHRWTANITKILHMTHATNYHLLLTKIQIRLLHRQWSVKITARWQVINVSSCNLQCRRDREWQSSSTALSDPPAPTVRALTHQQVCLLSACTSAPSLSVKHNKSFDAFTFCETQQAHLMPSRGPISQEISAYKSTAVLFSTFDTPLLHVCIMSHRNNTAWIHMA